MNRGVGVARRRFGDGRTVACGRGWRLLRAALLALVLSGTVTAVAGSGSAVAATGLPGSWASTFGLPGVDSSVAAVAVSGGQVYVGGSFTTFGGQPTNHYAHVAEWTGTQWVSLGAGLDGNVDAVAVLGGRVYVGGSSPTPVAWRRIIWRFGMASGGRGRGYRRDGIGAITPVVRALATDGTRLFLGGSFDSAGGHPANSVAVYTPGAGFAALAGGVQTCVACGSNVHPGLVTALRWTGNRLWIGGAFESAGPVSTYSFASWAAGTWTGYGTGLTQSGSQGTVQSLAVDSATGNVYAGGHFDSAGTGSAAGIAQLSHGAWSAIGDITAGGGITDVSGLAVLGGVLYAKGSFTTAGGVSVHDFAARTGTTWTQVGGGLDQPGAALAPYGAGVLVAGGFDKTSNSAVQLPALGWWTGRWQTLGQGPQQANNIPAIVQALASDGGKGVYVGGKFSQVGAVAASDIAQWTGTAWHALGTGMSLGGGAGGLVQAMAQTIGEGTP